MQQEVGFSQHRHQRVVRAPSGIARIRPVQRPLLSAVVSQHWRVQVQVRSGGTVRKLCELPVPYRREKTLTLRLAKTLEQILNGVVIGKTLHPQHLLQGRVRGQQTGVRKPPRTRQHRKQNAAKVWTGSMVLGELRANGKCSLTASS
jgi:hypothetical protein